MATVEGLTAFTGRGAGTDAERRAGTWLADRQAATGADVNVEPFWCRPNWALAHSWHAALAIAGSLLALVSPLAAIAILAVALISLCADAVTGVSLGRRLTPERASQNIVISPRRAEPPAPNASRLILTANYDAGRCGLAYRLRPVTARLTRALRGLTLGWLGWLAVAIVWLLAIAVARQTGHKAGVVGVLQFPPTVALLVAFALLLELATGHWSPAAGDNATGVAVALELAGTLAAEAPPHLELEVVLTGAGADEQIGLGRHLTARRGRWRRGAPRTQRPIVLGIAACGGGTPHWWRSDGAFLPLRYTRALRDIAARIAEEEPHLGIGTHLGRGSAGAFQARTIGLPALTFGCLDRNGVAPRSHTSWDTTHSSETTSAVDPGALHSVVRFALLLIDGIDAAVSATDAQQTPTPA